MVAQGDRVRVHGLRGRPELNGQVGAVQGAAPNGRFFVKLDGCAEPVSLQPANLSPADGAAGGASGGFPGGGMPGFGGGMPGFGGMPGMGGMGGMGGMPGMAGMPDPAAAMAGLRQAAQRKLHEWGLKLPAGVSLEQAMLGIAVAAAVALYFASRWVSWKIVGLAAGLIYGATQTLQGRDMLEVAAARLSSVVGRPVPPRWVLAAVVLAVCWASRGFFGESAGAAAAEPVSDGFNAAIKEAYRQGYDDALAGLESRPPKHVPMPDSMGGGARASGSGSSSSGFGVGSLFRYAMVAQYIYRMGSGPGGWSPQIALANAKASPMQAFMMMSMMSGMIF
eukprot:TRINITY_DN8251_c0_g1_i1.p1 TRINITY_DN8251_c0_g1~~TRINITY_DN8251_c0_g1_i1.p1  ORF type:complete len:336 (-),score=79.47 TRINITY_DN8251_c0_g1_i1:248-1255(-)